MCRVGSVGVVWFVVKMKSFDIKIRWFEGNVYLYVKWCVVDGYVIN